MTENKRFTTVELPKPNRWGIWYDGAYLSTYQVCILLNEYVDVKKENEELKFERDRYKRLSEIRQESINNRILTIKEFIDNCSDKEVKKTLEQLFHSEVKEYELSKKIRKLEKENEQLKQLIKETLEITPIEHSLAVKLKNSISEMYE